MITDYLHPELVRWAWEKGGEYRVTLRPHPELGRDHLYVEGTTREASAVLAELSAVVGPNDACTGALTNHCVYRYLRGGPVIMRPEVALCQALWDTTLRVPVEQFRPPFDIVGVALPREVLGEHFPSLTFVWKIFPTAIMVFTMSQHDQVTYHTYFGDDLPTIEDRLALREGVDNESDYRLLVVAERIALNLALLAASRPIVRSPLPKEVANKRMARNRGLRREGLEYLQEVSFRDLVLRPRSSSETTSFGLGGRQARQHRRGHWKWQPHGPRHSLRRYQWINEYWTHEEEADPDRPGATVVLS